MSSILIGYMLIVNGIGIVQMQQDKSRAVKGEWRISEKQLWIVTLIGGSIGTYMGMKWFRHKTKHSLFVYGVPAVIILQIGLFLYIALK